MMSVFAIADAEVHITGSIVSRMEVEFVVVAMIVVFMVIVFVDFVGFMR